MHPNIWGPHLWYIMHLISFEYPENPTEYDKRIYHDFYNSLKDVIPCIDCKKHYRDHITQYPITPHLDSRATLIKWVIQIHNFVNMSLGKSTMTNEQVMELYKNLIPHSPFIKINTNEIIKQKEEKQYYRIYIFIFLALLIIIAIKYYYQKYYFTF